MNRFLTSKEKFYEFLESGWTGRKDDEANKDESPEEPEQKKIKLDNDGDNKEKKKMRGQNKSRPHMKPQSYEDRRLCTSIIQVMTQTHLFNVLLRVNMKSLLFTCPSGARNQMCVRREVSLHS